MKVKTKVTQIGLDVHRKFSRATARSQQGEIVWRERLEHGDRRALAEQLARWPRSVPVILEGTFGWGWMSDELKGGPGSAPGQQQEGGGLAGCSRAGQEQSD